MKAPWWHRTKEELEEQIASPLPNVADYEKELGIRLSMSVIRWLKSHGVIK